MASSHNTQTSLPAMPSVAGQASAATGRSLKQLNYPNPLTAVFLRVLAWERFIAGRQLSVKDVVIEQVQIARRELGLPALGVRKQSGGADDFIQGLRDQKLLTPKGQQPEPLDAAWRTEWRMLYLPPHSLVRTLSASPIAAIKSMPSATSNFITYSVALRDPALPRLDVWVGPDASVGKACADRRGVYFLRLADKLYIGKSDEFDVRVGRHVGQKQPRWCVFVSLAEGDKLFTLDALGAVEGLLISFWNEICAVANSNRGADRQPAFPYLQQAVLFSEAASAILIWLIRDCSLTHLMDWSLPFKRFGNKAWPTCYFDIPGR